MISARRWKKFGKRCWRKRLFICFSSLHMQNFKWLKFSDSNGKQAFLDNVEHFYQKPSPSLPVAWLAYNQKMLWWFAMFAIESCQEYCSTDENSGTQTCQSLCMLEKGIEYSTCSNWIGFITNSMLIFHRPWPPFHPLMCCVSIIYITCKLDSCSLVSFTVFSNFLQLCCWN